jgi:ADP-heptose:LPS heptosyltransferase
VSGAWLPEVRSIVALRPGAIGDAMFALPALQALRHAYPEAHIVLIGKPWQAAFLAGRPGPVNEVLVMPPYPGIGLPPGAAPGAQASAFVEMLRARRFDLALQLYGGGRYSNPFVKGLGARLCVGTATPDAVRLDRTIAWRPHANQRLALLQVAALAGAVPCIRAPELAVTQDDLAQAGAVLPPRAGERIVVLHPGASDPRRRWAPERFAAVADALAERGATIVLSASEGEAPIAQAVVSCMRHPVAPLAGKLTLRGLCGMLARACMILANDTGPLHMALAVGTPAVGIFWHTNIVESGPLQPHLLSPAVSACVHCPVCGAGNRRERCVHDVSFVDDVETDEVLGMALDVYEGTCVGGSGFA